LASPQELRPGTDAGQRRSSLEALRSVESRSSSASRRENWLVIAATSVAAAERYVSARGIEPAEVVTRRQLRRNPQFLRRLVRDDGIDRAIVHSVDWSRQALPQLYEAALMAAPVEERYLADDRTGNVIRVDGANALRLAARLPLDGLAATACIMTESLRFAASRRRSTPFPRSAGRGSAAMAIWLGSLDSPVGGSVTHISGMLSGFQKLGVRVGLVTSVDPPEQLARVVDDVEITRPLSRGQRAVKDASLLAENSIVREAGCALAARLRPSFVYQRHRPFLFAGADLARATQLPLVLEWNNSEVWTRANWENPFPPFRALDGLLASTERYVVRAAARILAVSRVAADMALQSGADRATIEIVPNAADVGEIRRLIDGIRPRGAGRPLVGWIGSFGVWHGAEMLVRAVAQLDGVDLLMIGDGHQREVCAQLAGQLGLKEQIEWAGALAHDEAVRRLAACDVLASPHVPLRDQPFFGSPTKLFEYMAIGRPIVASNLGQLGDVLEHGRTAWLVEPGNISALVGGLAEVLAMPDRGASLGDAAEAEARGRHDWVHRARVVLDTIWSASAATA
jgi:glycosyltransferase involved in cell wall biosynthesis